MSTNDPKGPAMGKKKPLIRQAGSAEAFVGSHATGIEHLYSTNIGTPRSSLKSGSKRSSKPAGRSAHGGAVAPGLSNNTYNELSPDSHVHLLSHLFTVLSYASSWATIFSRPCRDTHLLPFVDSAAI